MVIYIMSNQLTLQINTLTLTYQNTLNILANQLKQNINIISAYKLPVYFKNILINNLRINYNNKVKQLTTEYTTKKNQLMALILSETISTTTITTITTTTTTTLPNKKALLIGINYNNTPNQLYGCINDANNIKNMLQTIFNYNTFTLLTDDTIIKPTKQNIINELTTLLVNSNSGDHIFLLYSGHGTCTIDLNNEELDGQDEMIVPLDAVNINTCILDDELKQIIQTNLKKDVTLFALFDSCFSGTVLDLPYNYLDQTNSITINQKESNTMGQVIMISGCTDNQTSADAYLNYAGKKISSGAMTYSFLNTINSIGKNISLKTLIENMRKTLITNGYTQTPQLSSGIQVDINTTMLVL